MTIRLNNVLPFPLAEILQHQGKREESDIWLTNITFEKGKLYQVDAPSGTGKSTLIHIIYGIRKDYQGEVWLDGQSIQKITSSAWANLRQERLSIIFQDLRLFLHLTAFENLQVKSVLFPATTDEEIEGMMHHLGVIHLKNKKAALLSYGERQRVAIIRALLQPFHFLLMDEPFSHLDEDNIAKACDLINQCVKKNQAGLLMTSLGFDYHLKFDMNLTL